MTLHLFIGPTASGSEQSLALLNEVVVHPPVRRGDIQTLVAQYSAPAVIAIVDGTFHSFPSVGHSEIRQAIQKGWQIWGLASMGAIRASEMHRLGMHGYGAVYERYHKDPEFDDDEVTLVHEIEAPYRAMSEPLIHIRGFISALQDQQKISAENALIVIKAMKERWYAERTLPRLKKLLHATGEMTLQEIDQALASFKDCRIKSKDLNDFLQSRCWLAASAG